MHRSMRTQPVEDIDSVIGRFQAWAGSRNAAEPVPGIRELSYEEALESRRQRWRTPAQSVAQNTLAKTTPENEQREEFGVARADTPGPAAASVAPGRKSAPVKNRGVKRRASAKTPGRRRAATPLHAAKAGPPPQSRLRQT